MELFPFRDPDAVVLTDGTTAVRAGALPGVLATFRATCTDDLGLRPGDHVALLTRNRTEAALAMLGGLLSGYVVTPVAHHLAPDELAYVLADSGARCLFVDAACAELAAGQDVRHVPIDGLADRVDPAAPAFAPGDPAGATMIYTSGTSGRPKGVLRARPERLDALVASYRAAGAAFGFDGRGPHLVTGPLYHAAPALFALYDLFQGAPMHIMPRWDEARFLAWVEAHRIAHTHLVPTMFVRLLRLPAEVRRAHDLSSLTLVMHGAAPITPETKAAVLDWLGDRVVEYWGATEGGIYTLCSADAWRTRPGTVGRAIGSYSVVAEDDAGHTLPPGEIGTLVCRHATLAEPFRYHRDPDKTAGCYRGPHRFTVGDLGHLDADGYVYLSERRTNLILSGGVNIYPAEIERVLLAHPDVADACVYGLPDPEWGETVHAAVQPRDGVAADEALRARLEAHLRAGLAGPKRPRSVELHDSLPRTEAGKMRVRDVRAAALAARVRGNKGG